MDKSGYHFCQEMPTVYPFDVSRPFIVDEKYTTQGLMDQMTHLGEITVDSVQCFLESTFFKDIIGMDVTGLLYSKGAQYAW